MRLLTYNIHKGIGGRDRRYRLSRVIEVIEHENPDVMCLQEVDRDVARSRHDNQPELLAEYFKVEAWQYQMNVHLRTGGYGNLILSRWPIVSIHQLSLRLQNKKPRGAQVAVVETPEGPLRVVNFHLGLAEAERHWQVGHLLGHGLFREADNLPTVVAGDYNDWRNTLAHGALGQRDFTQVTAPPSRFRSFPAYLPLGSLDKAFIRGEIQVKNAFVVRTPGAKIASDHLPLVVDFHVGETNGELDA